MKSGQAICHRFASVYDQIKAARIFVADWLADFDTRGLEYCFCCSAIINACQVATEYEGKSLAPFLETAIWRLDQAAPYWVLLLALSGCASFVALILGTLRAAYLARGVLMLFQCFLWSGIVFATLAGPQPKIVVARYVLAVMMTLVSGLALIVKHCDQAIEKELIGEVINSKEKP